MALGCNRSTIGSGQQVTDVTTDYQKLGTAPGFCHHCQTGQCSVGITTQDPELEKRLVVEDGARWVRNLWLPSYLCGRLDGLRAAIHTFLVGAGQKYHRCLGRLAQLVRALSSHGRGHWFESSAAHS